MDRPKIKITPDSYDLVIEVIGAAFLVLMIALPLYDFNELSETIPTHFDASGNVDGVGQRSMVWILPVIGFMMYIGMFFLNKYPHVFNYPKEITEENAARQYRMATKLVRTLNTLIAASFSYIVYSTLQTSLNNGNGLGTYFLPIFMIAIFGTIGIYLYSALKKNPTTHQ